MNSILLIDNNDSFTYNIVELIRKIGLCGVDVIESNKVHLDSITQYHKIIFSPGPGVPDDFPLMKMILSDSRFSDKHILGICLGFQAISEFYGCELVNKHSVVHGEKHLLSIIGESKLFVGLEEDIYVGLYHSWEILADSVHEPLKIIAYGNNSVMSIQHTHREIYGIQFHPESYMTCCGESIIRNFIML